MSDGGDERRAGGLVSDEENDRLSSTQLEQNDGKAAGASIPGVAGIDTPNDRNRR